MISQYLFANSDQRLEADSALRGHGYDTWCCDIADQRRILVVDHPDAYIERVNNLIHKACPTMCPELGATSDALSA
jgi:hypothetical protein